MATKNKSFASKALLEMDEITSAIKEESKKSLSSFLNEAVKNALRESCNEDDEEKDYEIEEPEDDKKDDNPDGGKKEKKNSNSKKSTNEDGSQEMNGYDGGSGMGQQFPKQNANPQMGGNQEMEPSEAPDDMGGQDMGDMEGQGDMAPEDGEGDESWNEFEKYKVGDNAYDLTGENDYDSVVKVYKLLNDEDQIVVKQDGETLHLKDNDAGTEYVIDLGSDDDEEQQEIEPSSDEMEGEEEMPEGGLNEELYYEDEGDYDDGMAGVPFDDGYDEFNDEDHDEFGDEFQYDSDYDEFNDEPEYNEFDDEFENNSDYDSDYDEFSDESDYDDEEFGSEDFGNDYDDEYHPELYENKKNKKMPMKESKKVLFEVDLGYTDNYQDKDPIQGLSNNEPAKGKKSWHKGVPTGTAKPWAGETKSKGAPFKETTKVEGSVNEDDMSAEAEGTVDEANLSQSRWNDTHASGNRIPAANSDEHRRKQGMQKTHKGGQYRPVGSSQTNESKELAAIKNKNKELKKVVVELRKNLNEAYITNVNLGKIAKLFLENTTTQKEKIDIVNRFSNEAKTIEQSKALYESINKQLKKANKSISINESSKTANGTKVLNEEKVYRPESLLKTIDFMNRVLNC